MRSKEAGKRCTKRDAFHKILNKAVELFAMGCMGCYSERRSKKCQLHRRKSLQELLNARCLNHILLEVERLCHCIFCRILLYPVHILCTSLGIPYWLKFETGSWVWWTFALTWCGHSYVSRALAVI